MEMQQDYTKLSILQSRAALHAPAAAAVERVYSNRFSLCMQPSSIHRRKHMQRFSDAGLLLYLVGAQVRIMLSPLNRCLFALTAKHPLCLLATAGAGAHCWPC